MTTILVPKSSEPIPLDQVLESAVVINWNDLIRGSNPALIHLEYHIGEAGFIDNLRIWSSTARGYWSLVCQCLIDPDLSCTVNFRNGYEARDLGKSLQTIMKRQAEFPYKSTVDTNHLVQVGQPTVDLIAAAKTNIEKVGNS